MSQKDKKKNNHTIQPSTLVREMKASLGSNYAKLSKEDRRFVRELSNLKDRKVIKLSP